MQLVLEVTTAARLRRGSPCSPVFGGSGGIIGRHPDCDWSIEDDLRLVSAHHARIVWRNGRFALVDISRNGIARMQGGALVRGQESEIADGAGFRFGELEIIAHLSGSGPGAVTDLTDRDPDPLRMAEDRDCDYALVGELAGFFDQADARQWSDSAPADRDHLLIPRLVPGRKPESGDADGVEPSAFSDTLWQRLEAVLGIGLDSMAPQDRDACLLALARQFRQCIGGLQLALKNRADLQTDMGLCAVDAGMALQSSGDTQETLRELLAPGPSLPASEARIRETFRQMQAHEVALVAAGRAAARAALAHFSPQQLNWEFERDSSRPVINTAGSRWRAYLRFHHALSRTDDWSDELFARHFSHAYQDQLRLIDTLHLDFQG